MEYHVAVTGNDRFCGSSGEPFRTISKAAETARSGDTVTVHEGVYREWVKPAHGGRSDSERITYQAAPGEHVVIKGSEEIKDWERFRGNVWRAEVPASLFGAENPFAQSLWGDWLIWPEDGSVHAGDVYLNGKSMYEAYSLEDLENPSVRTDGYNPPWTKHREPIPHPEDTLYQWFAEVRDDKTVIYANFQGTDPNQELTEISVRRCCFYPERTGINYITVRGFEMAQAASPWAPPTADQPGMLGAHWSKGWIIEENILHDAKCSAVSIGKEYSTGDNECTRYRRKPGYQYQMEAVFKAVHKGWDKETIGGHVIRNNRIHDCGQNGIVGHLGCIFSRIYGNEIYNIGVKHEFFGYEIAGIKLHAAIDAQIEENYIHDCTLGTWLDWEAQGTRVSRNVYAGNDRDLMIEVTHGPHTVDNNIFASSYSLDNIAQGGAYINNLICGTMRREPVPDRTTPYHMAHSTVPLGTAFVYGGDDRWYQNIFLGGQTTYTEQSVAGTGGYNGHPASMEEYRREIAGQGNGDHEAFDHVKQPVYIHRNCYLNGASAYEKETDAFISKENPEVRIEETEEGVYLNITVPEEMLSHTGEVITTEMLDMPRIVEERYEAPDGSAVVFDTDIRGEKRGTAVLPGPAAILKKGKNRILVWKKTESGN